MFRALSLKPVLVNHRLTSGLRAVAVAALLFGLIATTEGALVGYWDFDGTVNDLSGKGHHGTLQPAGDPPTYTAPGTGHSGGAADQALDYPGGDRTVNLGNPADLQLQRMAVSFWMNADLNDHGIIAKGASRSSNHLRNWDIFGNGTNLVSLANYGAGNVFLVSATFPSTGAWHHVVSSWDGTDTANGVKLYVDGSVAAQATANLSNGPIGNQYDLFLGGSGTSWSYDGRLDEVAIFNTSLSDRRVSELHSGTATPLDFPGEASGPLQEAVHALNPVAYWRLDEALGWPTAYDSTDNQLDGDVGGGTFQRPSVSPVAGTAFDFDNSGPTVENIDVGNPTQLQLGEMSIAFWMNARTMDDGIITKGNSREHPSQRDWDIFGDGDELCFLVSDGSSAIIDLREPFPSLGRWHYVVATWDGTTGADGAKLYVDGDLLGTDVASSTLVANTHDLFLGGSANYRFEGLLDEVAIFGSALSAAEIRGLYSAVVPEPSTLLLLSLGAAALGLPAWRKRTHRATRPR